MFGSGNFWNKSPSLFLKILKLPLFYSVNFEIFKNALDNLSQITLPNVPNIWLLVLINYKVFLTKTTVLYNQAKSTTQ